jgi:hypothetical protein
MLFSKVLLLKVSIEYKPKGCFVSGCFVPIDILSAGRFVPPDVLSCRTFCPMDVMSLAVMLPDILSPDVFSRRTFCLGTRDNIFTVLLLDHVWWSSKLNLHFGLLGCGPT